MGGDDLIDEPPEKRLASTYGSESQRLVALDRMASRLRASVEIHRKGSSPIPEPVPSGRGNQGQGFSTQGRVQVYASDPSQKVLLQEPLFDPHEGGIIVFNRNHHCSLQDEPLPQTFGHRPEVD